MPGHPGRGPAPPERTLARQLTWRRPRSFSAALYILARARDGIAARRKRGDRKQHDEKDFVLHGVLLSWLKTEPSIPQSPRLEHRPSARESGLAAGRSARPTLACPCRAFHGNALGCTNDQDIRIDGRRYGPESWGWEQPGCRGPAALALSSTTCIASCRNTRPANWLRAARWRTPSPRWTRCSRATTTSPARRKCSRAVRRTERRRGAAACPTPCLFFRRA